uniref:Uncharacterized protein n=1 Tax=Candidatus Methanogaster sp. ANME-2c ERB4 TaxID=2759911 RepID=A0A7G9YJI3_9EURY|nr:hypothetical protein KNONPEEI_00022 [Methanosarcinales archaeon ANME-2c ERB4]QNO48167.1 hypothetical protein GOJLPIDM_00023 [Methanosarcinales archaeon ANME-2c ERB4]
MDIVPKTKIDLSKITSKYPLLGLFLLVIEGLLGFWLFQAGSAIERVVAGILMTLLLGAFLFVVKGMQEGEVSGAIVPQGLDNEVTPARKEATEEEIDFPEPQAIAAPDRSYIINKPPEGWIVQELTFADWMAKMLKITDPSTKERLCGTSQVREILGFNSRREISYSPITGKTLLDGRKVPTALELTIPTRLSILPMDRAQPPLFVERPLMHNFFTFVGHFSGGVATMHGISLGTIPNSQRRYLVAEFRQELENAIVDGNEGKNINNNITIIGIEGDLHDHLLLMQYPTLPVVDDPELERDLQTLQSLVSSFRPLKITNPDEKRMEIKNMADQNFKELMMKKGKEIFDFEFGLTLFRLKGCDMNDPEKRLRVMKMLKSFEVFAKEINLQDEKFNALWDSLHLAEGGDASGFKDKINQMISTISGESESGQEDLHSLTSGNDEEKRNLNET